MSSPFQRILAAEIDGRTQNIRYRQNQLHRLQSTLLNHVRDLKDAILADSGNTVEEAEIEIYLAFKELCTSYLSLNLEESLEEEYRVARGRDNPGWKRGVGIVYIVPTTHTLFYSVIAPMSAAIAAGNCVIVEVCSLDLTKCVSCSSILTDEWIIAAKHNIPCLTPTKAPR